LTSILIGTLRDLRVNYYKHLSKDTTLNKEDKNLYSVISQAIKVILNATYGVMGADIFPLYCLPVAEATAAIGRVTTTKTIQKCRENNIEVIYGDTDSLFLKNPTKDALNTISSWAKKELGVDLEIDKHYRYVVFSDLKKNYLGVLTDGTVDVKGLTGKKSHTPPIIRSAFYDILNVLKEVFSEKDFEKAKEKIKKIVQSIAEDLEHKKISLEELSFNVMINKSPDNYGIKNSEKRYEKSISLVDGKTKDIENIKGIPQHIKAAKQLVDIGKQVKTGDIISYVKTRTIDGVKPVVLANQMDIDTEKYLETMESTFDQILSSLNLNFKSLIGKPRQTNLDELFWG
jgi:DNA polymerase I